MKSREFQAVLCVTVEVLGHQVLLDVELWHLAECRQKALQEARLLL